MTDTELNKISDTQQRVRQFINHLGIDVRSFEKSVGMKNGFVSKIGNSLREKTIEAILTAYPELDKGWLIAGVGEMLTDASPIAKETGLKNGPDRESFDIPMYNFPSAASDIQLYNNPEEVKVIGHLNLPGSTKDSFALPVYGHSMYPTLENGCWCVLRPLENPQEIVWGEIYYIEWGDYRMFKRLLKAETDDKVILWSDNQLDLINDKPKYSPVTIKKEKIRRLCLLTDIVKKPNY